MSSSSEPQNSTLLTMLSFDVYYSRDKFGGGEEDTKHKDANLERSVTIGDNIGSGDFSFQKGIMGLIKEEDTDEEDKYKQGVKMFQDMDSEELLRPASPPLYLAAGLGIGGGDGGARGGGDDFGPSNFDGSEGVEEYYKRMLDTDPRNPLYLRNYAQLLQSKGQLRQAEEYYRVATESDPCDGETLMQYAKLVWDLHHDRHRALSYFKRAAKVAAPNDSHVHAAYAHFLWELEDEDSDYSSEELDLVQFAKEDEVKLGNDYSDYKEEPEPVSPSMHLAAGLGIDMPGYSEIINLSNAIDGDSLEEYYKKMIRENPCNPLFLRNYAQFLLESKGDLAEAEEYYYRAVLADPKDGEMLSQYATLVWQLHADRDKAARYFERAVEASPGDSLVLAAYASFLWETGEDDEEDNAERNSVERSCVHAAMTSASSLI